MNARHDEAGRGDSPRTPWIRTGRAAAAPGPANPPEGPASPGRPFDVRAFVALTTALCGLGLPLTGLPNHFLGFSPLTTERHAWMAAHNVLGLAFVVFAVWHAVLNRRVLARHLRRAAGRVPGIRREALLAAAGVALLLLLSVGHAFLAATHGGDGRGHGAPPPPERIG